MFKWSPLLLAMVGILLLSVQAWADEKKVPQPAKVKVRKFFMPKIKNVVREPQWDGCRMILPPIQIPEWARS